MTSIFWKRFVAAGLMCGIGAAIITCTGSGSSGSSGGDGTSSGTCALTKNTTETSTKNSYGCHVLTRDTSSCETDRTNQGLSGFWLKFSCRTTLTKSGATVTVQTDDQPDYKSQYFSSTDDCYEAFSAKTTNPNTISTQNVSMSVPYTPATTTASHVNGAVIGITIAGVTIYGNFAAPGDDIYNEVKTFDKCDGHPDMSGRYHFHTEPESITSNDSAFVGVMRDGFPIYGRKDPDGSTPTLDSAGGHSGFTVDSPSVAVYHYHVNLQSNGTTSAYFISTGYYAGTPGACAACN